MYFRMNGMWEDQPPWMTLLSNLLQMGGGAGGFGEGAYIHDRAYITKEAKDRQIKQRAKIELNSLDKMPDWDGENESWADFSEHFIDLMTIAG